MYMKILTVFNIINRSYYETTKRTKLDSEWLLVNHENQYNVLAIRGTEKKAFLDVLCNLLSLIPYKSKFGWVSLGYYKAAERIANQMIDVLQQQHYVNHPPIIVCGHSLGAITSFFVANILSNMGFPISAWVGVGTLNGTLSNIKFNFKAYNFRFRSDISNLYPFKFLGFKQPHPLINIKVDKPNHNILDDHHLINYINHAPDMDI